MEVAYGVFGDQEGRNALQWSGLETQRQRQRQLEGKYRAINHQHSNGV